MIRSRSKDGFSAQPGPVYMSSEQKAKYLLELRTNRPQRPTGARPAPTSYFSTRDTTNRIIPTEDSSSSSVSSPTGSDSSPTESQEPFPRSSSALSKRMSRSETPTSVSSDRGRPVAQPLRRNASGGTMKSVNSITSCTGTYKESGKRSMEKMEVNTLRKAMEDLDMDEEQKLFKDAQDEAADLVWRHRNPNAPYPNPDAPYKYPGLSRKDHGRSQSFGGAEGMQRTGSKAKHRYSYAAGISVQVNADSVASQKIDKSSPLKDALNQEGQLNSEKEKETQEANREKPHARNDSGHDIIQDFKSRRRTSGNKRTPSGSLFRNPEDKIYEEPEELSSPNRKSEETPKPAPMPLQVRRNPFARVKFAVDQLPRSHTDPTSNGKLDKFEIHKNPPSQSRNAGYTSNNSAATPLKPKSSDSDEVKLKDGKEVRGDDIRAATSLRLRDRSPRLPTPTVVSDRPGRPIVSFKDDWKPKEVELKEEKSNASAKADTIRSSTSKMSASPLKAISAPAVPTLHSDNSKPVKSKEPALPPIKTFPKYDHTKSHSSSVPTIGEMPPIPVICAPDDMPTRTISTPEDKLPPSLTIGIDSSGPSPASSTVNSVPTFSFDQSPSKPSTKTSGPGSVKSPVRPLPVPSQATKASSWGPNNTSRSHWTPTTVRTGVLCNSCALPISGRIVSAAGQRFHPECFSCHHCAEKLECVAFYPEPTAARDERLARIHARQQGYDTPTSWPSPSQDGDESMRFYCHLDFHEFFSPRCKSCKTPIEGEVVVACGAEWHVGHFFCAQCGDPFDASTPFVEKEGYAWCVGCHTNRYSAKCRGCRKPITEVVVKALGSEWHDTCFVCVECKGPFDDGRYFLRGEEQDPVCVRCEERRLKA
ncbi:hypothetical protein EJ05DRAFT_507273 [Pseudovirgaria hyperparasitica]|uniref:LIM zinc-binding domain-containing protein n=1 Tax=Pseudovirgaria hyperparasitica TaxID=470096 RepID=A0A6A6WHR4_9PEZI|nr:uncharacterized protein EJ05DRAFT_507273 [Pseudovirgaria hyperparasitica]KAF2761624.1 hypothetical protein EJ05DRAFT_507273 [Pseudovirgaria hyperparasitica]